MKKEVNISSGRKWNQFEIEFLRENYKTLSQREISKELGRTESSINHKICKLNLIKRNKWVWGDTEIKFLEKNYRKVPTRKISKAINKPMIIINIKAMKLGLARKKLTKEDYEKIIKLYTLDKLPSTKIGKMFGVSCTYICNILKRNGIKKNDKKVYTTEKWKWEMSKLKKEGYASGKLKLNVGCFREGDPRISGKNNFMWVNGKSFEKYGVEFSKGLKQRVRKRDNFSCRECGAEEFRLDRNLDIHHIDYNKKNNSLINLISLCWRCHGKTQDNRKHWEEHFKMKMFIKELFNPRNILVFNENKQLIGVNRI